MCSLHIQAPGGHISDCDLTCRLEVLGATARLSSGELYASRREGGDTKENENLRGCLAAVAAVAVAVVMGQVAFMGQMLPGEVPSVTLRCLQGVESWS